MSSVVGEDTMQSLETGRQSLMSTLRVLQKHLQKAFIVFVIGMLGTVYAFRIYVWDFLSANAKSQVSVGDAAFGQIKIIAQTPFDVILLQVKIGAIVGILLAIPTLAFLARDAVLDRAAPSVSIRRSQVAGLVTLGLALFAGGMVYAYTIFFPFMFEFLANNAAKAGIQPKYGIVEFTEFVVFLTLSFGLAAELPLLMGAFSYSEIIPYEFWRDKWRHAVVAIVAFGGFFSPPDPFTQLMWAIPLVALYGFSLGLAKVVANVRRSSAADPGESGAFAWKTLQLGGVTAVVTVLAYLLVSAGLFEVFNESIRPALPAALRPSPLSVESIAPMAGVGGRLYVSLLLGLAVAVVVVTAAVVHVLRQPIVPRDPLRTQDPAEIDVGELDIEGVRAAPIEAFAEMSEEEAVSAARVAMDEDDPDRAQAILDRFDEAHAPDEGGDEAEPTAETAQPAEAEAATETDAPPDESGEEEDVVTGTAAGMMDAFTEEETTEDDIGGYYYDLRFIFESLTSKLFRIVVVFMVILFSTFFALYRGGIGLLMSQFLSRVSPGVLERILAGTDEFTIAEVEAMSRPELIATLTERQSFVITLHPVEALIFAVKLSAIIAIVAVVPLVLYYAWPALEERRLVSGDRRVFGVWGVSLFAGFLVGSVLGFFVVAPATISFLVSDALLADMVIAYRLNKFFWMVFMLTGGIGLFVDVIVTVVLFHVGGIVSFETMAGRWRETIFAVFVFAMFATSKSVLTMLLLGLPFAGAFLLGLGLLWLATLRDRLRPGRGAQPS